MNQGSLSAFLCIISATIILSSCSIIQQLFGKNSIIYSKQNLSIRKFQIEEQNCIGQILKKNREIYYVLPEQMIQDIKSLGDSETQEYQTHLHRQNFAFEINFTQQQTNQSQGSNYSFYGQDPQIKYNYFSGGMSQTTDLQGCLVKFNYSQSILITSRLVTLSNNLFLSRTSLNAILSVYDSITGNVLGFFVGDQGSFKNDITANGNLTILDTSQISQKNINQPQDPYYNPLLLPFKPPNFFIDPLLTQVPLQNRPQSRSYECQLFIDPAIYQLKFLFNKYEPKKQNKNYESQITMQGWLDGLAWKDQVRFHGTFQSSVINYSGEVSFQISSHYSIGPLQAYGLIVTFHQNQKRIGQFSTTGTGSARSYYSLKSKGRFTRLI